MDEDLIVGRYEILEDLGDRKKAMDRLTGHEVVVRSKPLDAPPAEELLEKLTRLRHPNLAAFIHHFPIDGELMMITEGVPGATLESLLTDAKPIDAHQAKTWMLEMVAAAQTVHAAHLLVGEFSPAKVVVGVDKHIKLIDPGLSGTFADASSIQTEVSTLIAIYRRMLGEAALENPILEKLDAAPTCSAILTVFKEAEVVPSKEVVLNEDPKTPPPKPKRFAFQKWDRRHVIAIIATLVGIFVGYKIATYGQSQSLLNRWTGH